MAAVKCICSQKCPDSECEVARVREEAGEPHNIVITAYYKYQFTICFTGSKNYKRYQIEVGGDRGDIYRFDPFGGWDEWIGAGIRYVMDD